MTLSDAGEELQYQIDSLRASKNVQASNAKIISILQTCPCLLRCVNDIEKVSYSNRIDPLYISRHDYAKNKIIEAIRSNFGSCTSIKSELQVNNGTFDIAVKYDRIVLTVHEKVICVEVKSGKSVDLYQLERYLYECDVLVFVRVPTRNVTAIHHTKISNELNASISLIIQKIAQINANDFTKIQGEWCKGYTANCEFKIQGIDYNNNASLADTEDFVKNVYAVVEKTISVLKKELADLQE